jgi:opacity protein-like surface antigen
MRPPRSLLAVALTAAALAAPVAAGASPGYYHGPPPPPVAYHAPRPATWYLGIGLFGTSILDQTGGPEVLDSGGGVSVWAGVHLGQVLSLEIGWLGSFHNPAEVGIWFEPDTDFLVLEGVTADAKLHLARGGGLDPYLQGGVGLYFLGSEHFGTDSVGTGFQLGGGIDFWLGPHVTLGLRGRYHGISLGPPNGGIDDTFISAATFEGSLGVHF